MLFWFLYGASTLAFALFAWISFGFVNMLIPIGLSLFAAALMISEEEASKKREERRGR